MKITTIYELLGMVKYGQAPKKIKYKDTLYEYDSIDEFYFHNGSSLYREFFKNGNCLNNEVEILEEEKKIPEKIDIRIDATNTEYIKGKTYGKNYSKSAIELAHTINEIIDCLDYLKSEENLKNIVVEGIPQFEGTLEQLDNLCNIKSKGDE